MLIDDSEGEALFVKNMLREAGFDDPIFHVRDPEEGIAYLSGQGLYGDRAKFPLPEILLLDLGMPQIDGFQILRWIRTQPHLVPMNVVVLTGETDPKRIALAYQLGANSFLSKAGSLEEFRNFVHFFRGFARIGRAISRLSEPVPTAVPMPAPVSPKPVLPAVSETGDDVAGQASA